MSKTAIPKLLRHQVFAESRQQSAYCHCMTAITGARPVIDHIVPIAAGGKTELANLCLACHSCNEFEAARLQADDPGTGEPADLYHPRRQRWIDHFGWSVDGSHVVGLTATGRATVMALKMNHPLLVQARRRWVAVGWHPPAEDR